MEQKILEALNRKYPVEIVEVEAVTNEMYRCMAKEGNYFARITNYKNLDEQEEEVNYTDFLHKEGLGVPPSVVSLNGKSVEKLTLDEREIVTVLYRSAPGVHLPRKQWNAAVFKELGRQVGRMHRFSKEYEKRHPTRYIKDWEDNEEYNFLEYIPLEETTIRKIADEVLTAVKSIPKNDSTYGLLHGDLWLGNILADENLKLTMIDFQDCEKHFYIYDLAVPIYSAVEFSYAGGASIVEYEQGLTKAIIEGYQEENELSGEMLERFPLIMKLKEMMEYSLMHMYWNKEKLTEEQVRILNLYRMRLEQDSLFKLSEHG